jgi:chemotaxis protein MotB
MRKAMVVLAGVAFVGCSGVSKEQYKAKEAEATKAQAAAKEQGAKVAELEGTVTSLQQQNETLQSQTQQLQSQNQALKTQTSTLQSSAADLEKKLHESTAATSELEQNRPVKVEESVLFKEDSSTLTPEGKRTLDSIAQAIAGSTDKAIVVSGFTDSHEGAGKDPKANRWKLSSARSMAVAKYLAGRGIDPSLIAVAGFGEARPVAPNDSLASRSLNRRVEIVLTPANQEMTSIGVKPAELMPQGTGKGQGQESPGQGQSQGEKKSQ